MTGRGGKGRGRKALETTLGTAPPSNHEKIDLSQVQKPMNTSVFGLKQVLSIFQTGTDEVQNYIAYECDVLYECRTCRSIFRSLANFILHKRNFCKDKFHTLPNSNHEEGFVVESSEYGESSESRPISPDEINTETSNKTKKDLSPIIEKLRKYQEIAEYAKETMNEDLTIVKNVKSEHAGSKDLILERIETNDSAVFQTAAASSSNDKDRQRGGLMKSEVMEIHDIFDNNEAVLDAEGKIRNFDRPKTIFPKQDLVCTECDYKFATVKTLTNHIKYKHNKTCTIFPCPDCKETFVNAWCVYRHLYKIHRRTSAQVKRLRGQIHSGAVRKEQEPALKKIKREVDDLVIDSENQWMANFEGDKDLQMCGGCGRKFERKAALQSHSALCSKRMAVCSNIKENTKVIKEKVPAIIIRGAAKRKCIIIKSKPKEVESNNSMTIMGLPIGVSSNNNHKDDNDSDTSAISNISKTPPKRIPMPEKARTPEKIEVFDISDDSCDSPNPEESKIDQFERIVSKNPMDGVKQTNLKRRRTQSCDTHQADDSRISKCTRKLAGAFTDETDESFIARASPYMKKNDLKCISCQTTFSSLFQLLWHMSQHFSWYRFHCSKCSFRSFNKFDCSLHAFNVHDTPKDLLDSTILPIPKWKILCTAHKFKRLKERGEKEKFADIINDLKMENGDNKAKPVIETIVLDEDNDSLSSSSDGEKVSELDHPPQIFEPLTVISEGDSKFCKRSHNNNKAGPSGEKTVTRSSNRRPVRLRTKSVRTFQDDFIYDLENVIKPDNLLKNRLGPPSKELYKNRKRYGDM